MGRQGSPEERLSRRRALDRTYLPLERLCASANRLGCSELWVLWGEGGAEGDSFVLAAAASANFGAKRRVRFQRSVMRAPFATAWLFTRQLIGEVVATHEIEEDAVVW